MCERWFARAGLLFQSMKTLGGGGITRQSLLGTYPHQSMALQVSELFRV